MMPYLSCKKIENDVYNFPAWQYCKYKDIFDSKILHIYFLSERFTFHRHKNFYTLFLNSICTPFGLFDTPQSLYLWAFPRFFKLLNLGKSGDGFKHICLVLISFLPLFYLCYIYYFGSLIFCCQFVVTSL